MGQLFLGLDCSTQSMSAVLLDYDSGLVVYDKAINFDKALPEYKTDHGTLKNQNSSIHHSPPLLWVEGLEKIFQKMKQDGVNLHQIVAIGGSAQQHGSVYLNSKGVVALKNLDPSKSLKENLHQGFSRNTSPMWRDSSTTKECEEIRLALDGAHNILELTGSNTFERFTGPQIRKFYKTEKENYHSTEIIALVSSFMASILSGQVAPIDHSDGSGMNLMDIQKKCWHPKALEATAPGLASKLPSLVKPWHILGPISSYFVDKYGFNPKTEILVWSGDNPDSLIGLGVIHEGLAAISLGTSFTYFGYMKHYQTDPQGEGHVFVAPTGDYMSLLCFQNGAIALEKTRDLYGLDWNQFNQAIMKTPPGNHGKLLLPYFEPEITPKVPHPAIHRLHLDPKDPPSNCRALVEAQMMSMKLHSQWIKNQPKEIFVTGGASVDPAVVQILADVFQCPVFQIPTSNSAALGSAIRAVHGYKNHRGQTYSWEEVTKKFIRSMLRAPILPSPETKDIYEELIQKYASFEQSMTS